jgi:hypothetical protein
MRVQHPPRFFCVSRLFWLFWGAKKGTFLGTTPKNAKMAVATSLTFFLFWQKVPELFSTKILSSHFAR